MTSHLLAISQLILPSTAEKPRKGGKSALPTITADSMTTFWNAPCMIFTVVR